MIATLNRLPWFFRNRSVLSLIPSRDHRRKEDHVALIALEAVDRIDHELQRRQLLREFAVLMHQRADAVGLRAERRDHADRAVVSLRPR